ncbi:MAG: phosphopantetheine-binding protein [Desulfobacterales bacterium]|nr:phosphopantetheine-binding protein [Desulfobacterales bacterium]
MSNQIIESLKQIIASELDVNISVGEIDENTSLFEEGIGLDSVVIVEFITLIEETFGFQFSEAELTMEMFDNLKAVAEAVSRHQLKKGA